MNKIRVIDLLNKIANEEIKKKPNLYNIPYKIKYDDIEYSLLYELGKDGKNYITYSEYNLSEDVYGELEISCYGLNDEVEIIEENPTLNDIRESYGLPRIEEHKIPEKINWKEKESMAGYLTKDKQIEVIAKRTEHLKKSINKIIDYLEVNND